MDISEIFTGGFIFNFIDACIRWTYGTIWRTIAKKKKFKFNEYLNGPKNSDDWFDITGHTFVNKVIGIVSLVVLILLLI